MGWTDEQYKAIHDDDLNILVSAAAGSGKTTVLIARIARLIIEKEIDVDRFLITTFTNAAAAEMRNRLEEEIDDSLKKCIKELAQCQENGADPEEIERLKAKKSFLQRQIRLLPEAHIETFHSFAISMIRDYFFLLDLQPGFVIGDDTKVNLMKNEVIDGIFERRFCDDSYRFKPFLRKYSSDRSDDGIKESILNVYKSMLSIPRYMDWAGEKIELLGAPSPIKALGIDDFIKAQSKATLLEAARYYLEAAIVLDSPKTKAIHAKAVQDAEHVRTVAEQICEAEGLDEIKGCLSIKLNQMRTNDDEKDAFERVKAEVQDLRKRGKKRIDDLKKAYFSMDEAIADETIGSLKADTEYLLDIIKELEEELTQRKRDENIIDFNDAMHYAIAILDDDKAAADYRDRFKYIFIDEYQDSNYLQEAIIDRIKGENNLFMVGDIKQSIYRFRLAEPDLFKEKYEDFGREENAGYEKIDLNNNFRSKGNIRRAVNTIFEDVMDGYDDNAALKGPEDGGPDGPEVQLHVIRDVEPDPEDKATEKVLDEATLVSRIIKEHIGKPYIDKKGNEQILKYSDIAVLARKGKHVSAMERVLNNEGVPAFGETGGGYYETVEVSLFIDLLRVINNMRQDVPLIAVMSAMFFDFTPAELARIRIESKYGSYCDAVLAYAENGNDEGIRDRIKAMIARIEGYREMSRALPLEELIRVLLYETGYYDYCSSLPAGSRRVSNLRLLLEKAQSFEKTSYSGLHGFLSYVEAMKKTSQKVNEASVAGEGEDAVRVMTIHKSKGLEYPMVILIETSEPTSKKSSGYDPVIDRDLSIGLPLIDRDLHIRCKTLLQLVINGKKKAEELEEEIRILYVALTRAIDRLVVIGTIGEKAELGMVPMKDSFLEMLYPAMCRLEEEDPEKARVFLHFSTDAEDSADAPGEATQGSGVVSEAPEAPGEASDGSSEAPGEAPEAPGEASDGSSEAPGEASDGSSETPGGSDDKLRVEIDRRLSYEYPYDYATGIRPKYSVTSLAKVLSGADDGPEDDESEDVREWDISMLPPAIPRIPELRSLDEENGGLSREDAGTLMHYMMEKIDFARAKADGSAYIREVAEDLHEQGVLDDTEYEAVSVEDIEAFFAGPVGERAAKATKLEKEKEFLMQEMIEGEPVIVQGIIDCYFEEEDGLVLIDYKNSYLPEGGDPTEIIERYVGQLRMYRRALEKACDKPVKEAWLYLFKCGRFLKVDTD